MSKRVLITGVSGFVGNNLVQYLREYGDYHIVGVTRSLVKCKHIKQQLDHIITYEELFNEEFNYEIVVHLAGQVIMNYEGRNSEEIFMDANFHLTKQIFDLFTVSVRSEKFIFLSSIHVLTEIPDRIITEDYSPNPFTPYGRSKYEAEQYIQDHIVRDKHIYIFRPTMIHGEGNRGNLKSLYDYLVKGYPYFLGTVNNKRSFLSVENLCFIINELIKNPISSGLYHLSDDEPTSTRELIDLFEEMLQNKIRRFKIPYSLLYLISKIGQILPIPFDDQRLAKLTSNFIVSNKKIISAIGKPLPLSPREGMRRTIQSFIKNEKLQ